MKNYWLEKIKTQPILKKSEVFKNILKKWKPLLSVANIPLDDCLNMAILYENQQQFMENAQYNDLDKRMFISMMRQIIYKSKFENKELKMEYQPIFKLLGLQAFCSPAGICIDKTIEEPCACRSKKMRACWTHEAMQDLRCVNNLDAECEIANIVSLEIINEFTLDVIQRMSRSNVIKVPQITSNAIQSYAESMETKPNWIIVDEEKYGTEKDEICSSLYNLNINKSNKQLNLNEFKTCGYMKGLGDKVIIGYKNSDYDASIYFLPYILLAKTPNLNCPDFCPRPETIMRYALCAGSTSREPRFITLDATKE